MKEFIKHILKSRNLYYKLKYSGIFKIYQHVFKPEVIKQHKKEVSLYRGFLGNCNLVFDIGAYDGHKTAAFKEISKKVVSCEPDPFNYQVLKTRFRNDRNIHIINKAILHYNGEATLQRNDEGSAFNTFNHAWKDTLEKGNISIIHEEIIFRDKLAVQVETTTLDDLVKEYGMPDFIKIDVEGSELEVFRGLSHTIKSISFECTLPVFARQLNEIINMLLSKNKNYKFNIIFDEELLFKKHVNHPEILEWLGVTDLQSFDMLVITA